MKSFLGGEGVLAEGNVDRKAEGMSKGKRGGHTKVRPGGSMDGSHILTALESLV